MRPASFACLMMLGGCTAYPPIAQPSPTPVRTANFAESLLGIHNAERAAVGSAPLLWDPVLAVAAGVYAAELARTGVLRHSPRAARPGQGENLWMGTRGAFAPAQMAGSWASERRWFRPGIFPSVSNTGNWADVGHYTQMIWPTTTRVGCALASSARADFLVCRYAPAGNIDGRRVP
jgi:hypothetical protein